MVMGGGLGVDNYRQPFIELYLKSSDWFPIVMTGGSVVDNYG